MSERDPQDIIVEELHCTREAGLQMRLKHPLFAELTNDLLALLKEHGAENYLSFSAYHDEAGPFLVTIQRQHGKSPAEIAHEARTALVKMTAERDLLRTVLADIVRISDRKNDAWDRAHALLDGSQVAKPAEPVCRWHPAPESEHTWVRECDPPGDEFAVVLRRDGTPECPQCGNRIEVAP